MKRFFFSNLKRLENATLPLSSDEGIGYKVGKYFLQSLTAVGATCALAFSFPFAITRIAKSSKVKPKPKVSKALPFPQDFKLGIADSFYQSCGLGQEGSSDWAHWAKAKDRKNTPRVQGGPDLSKFFLNYLDEPHLVIEKLKSIGASVYRFSLERSVLEPKENEFDQSYIQKYRHFIQELKNSGIEPMLTIHHFTNPQWFLEKGGFEKEENIESFVHFAEKMADSFGDLVVNWITINEPAIYAFQAYLKGLYPPGKKSFHLTGKVLIHLLKAHIRIYERLKAKHPQLQIGISHNFLWVEPYTPLHPLERAIAHYFSEITHNALFRFFQTGIFSFRIPFLANVNWQEPMAMQSLDFIGVQYYVTPLVKIGLFSAQSAGREGEKIMGLGARFYPEGIEEALNRASLLNKPIWITETGCDTDQSDYFTKAFSLISHSIAKGIDLRGALIWTLRDNLEWERGDAVKIGLMHGNFEEKPVVNEVIRPLFQSLSQSSKRVKN